VTTTGVFAGMTVLAIGKGRFERFDRPPETGPKRRSGSAAGLVPVSRLVAADTGRAIRSPGSNDCDGHTD
jgi:hypothetical protein